MPPEYVLDKMEMYEIRALLNFEYFSHKDEWEQARLIAYMIAQTNSKNKLKFSDIVNFYWENEQEKEDTAITREQIERLKQKSQEYLEKLKEKENGRVRHKSERSGQLIKNS